MPFLNLKAAGEDSGTEELEEGPDNNIPSLDLFVCSETPCHQQSDVRFEIEADKQKLEWCFLGVDGGAWTPSSSSTTNVLTWTNPPASFEAMQHASKSLTWERKAQKQKGKEPPSAGKTRKHSMPINNAQSTVCPTFSQFHCWSFDTSADIPPTLIAHILLSLVLSFHECQPPLPCG